MPEVPTPVVRRRCAGCGKPALVPDSPVPYRCDDCSSTWVEAEDDPGERHISRFWSDARESAGGVGGPALSALDALFNPSAARAQQHLRADHERQIPIPSPGDAALLHGKLILRMEPPHPAEEPAKTGATEEGSTS